MITLVKWWDKRSSNHVSLMYVFLPDIIQNCHRIQRSTKIISYQHKKKHQRRNNRLKRNKDGLDLRKLRRISKNKLDKFRLCAIRGLQLDTSRLIENLSFPTLTTFLINIHCKTHCWNLKKYPLLSSFQFNVFGFQIYEHFFPKRNVKCSFFIILHTSSGAPYWWSSSTTCVNPMTDLILTEPNQPWKKNGINSY